MSKRWMGAAVLMLGACATVKSSRVAPDYSTVDKDHVKRLLVVTAPLPEGQEKLGQLWSLLARRYVNQKRDFLVKADKSQALPLGTAFDAKSLCGEGLEGVLWLSPKVSHGSLDVDASVDAKLIRCLDGGEVWSARAGGSWPSRDSTLQEMTGDYVAKLGPEVKRYVSPSFHLLKETLDTLPNPHLSDEDQNETIELGE